MGIYLKYGDIKGDATHDAHKQWIDVLQINWGAGRNISSTGGSACNRISGKAYVSQVQLVKLLDGSSPKLFTEACTGSKGVDVVIDVTSSTEPSVSYCTYTLKDALIASYNVSTSGETPTESISISFTKLEFKFTPAGPDNKTGTPVTVSYDLATAKPT